MLNKYLSLIFSFAILNKYLFAMFLFAIYLKYLFAMPYYAFQILVCNTLACYCSNLLILYCYCLFPVFYIICNHCFPLPLMPVLNAWTGFLFFENSSSNLFSYTPNLPPCLLIALPTLNCASVPSQYTSHKLSPTSPSNCSPTPVQILLLCYSTTLLNPHCCTPLGTQLP